MAKRYFEAKIHTLLYGKFRYPVPDKVMSPIFDYLHKSMKPPYNLIVDVGCGTGQATNTLAKRAKQIIGTDISEGQIKIANESPSKAANVQYRVSAAENMPFVKDGSVDLVSASQCFHWFDQKKFYTECHRILKPGGALAAYVYGNVSIRASRLDDAQNKSLENSLAYFREVIEPLWDPRRKIITSKFEGITLPFDDFEKTEVSESFESDVDFIMGYLQTFSPYQSILKNSPEDAEELLKTVHDKFEKAFGQQWKGGETPVTMVRPFVIMLGRKGLDKC